MTSPPDGAIHEATIAHPLGDVALYDVSHLLPTRGRKPQPAEIETMCQKLLANPVIEDYRFEIEEVVRA